MESFEEEDTYYLTGIARQNTGFQLQSPVKNRKSPAGENGRKLKDS
jgi:hypothetical protein